MKLNKAKIIRWMWVGFVLFWLTILGTFAAIALGWIGYMPPLEQLQNPIDKYASQLISSDGETLGSYAQSGGNRVSVDYKDISPHLINALIATEDVRFHGHSGIDFRSVARAVFKTGILGQRSAGGGSTITQQLAKQLYSAPTKGFLERLMQKPIEWVIAVKLERLYTKEEIITFYLNQFDFLYNAVGIQSAAQTYFGKKPSELNAQEAAMLVGMCKNPSLYNPIRYKDTDRPIGRRNVVFEQMTKAGYITAAQADSLSALPLKTSYHKLDHKEGPAPYLREHLRKVMMAKKPDRSDYREWQREQYSIDSLAWEDDPLYGWCNKHSKADGSHYNIYTDGLRIYTTVSSTMQRYAEEAMREHMAGHLQPAFNREKKGRKDAPFASSLSDADREAILLRAMKQSDRWRESKEQGLREADILKSFKKKQKMQVWTWEGMRDTILTPLDSIRHLKSILRSGFMAMNPHNGHVLAYVGGINFSDFQYDMVSRGRRQTGSIIKPYLYSLSMIEGFSPCDEVLHVQQVITLPNGQKWIPRNTNSRRIGEMVSLQWGLQHSDNWVTAYLMSQTSPKTFLSLLRSFGMQGQIEATMAMSLGTPDASIAEMVSGYSTFLNRGIRVSPLLVTHIEDKMGNVVATFSPQMTEVLPQDAANKMLYMLQNVVNGGTAGRLRARYNLTMPLGGKTGTTNNNSDSWFIGFSPDIVAGCWVGGEERSIRFSSMTYGQGAAAALPIFALFMKKVYADPKLGYKVNTGFGLPPTFSPCNDAGDYSGEEMPATIEDDGGFTANDIWDY